MTTEGRPEYVDVDWDKQYNKQRRNRLDDAISEYLNDDTKTDPRHCYEDILSVVQEWVDYHQNNLNRWNAFKSLMLGNRDIWTSFSDQTIGLAADTLLQDDLYGEDTLTSGNIDLDIA